MTTPVNDIVQIEYRNPAATKPLFMPVLVTCNTTDEIIEQNIIENSAKELRWLCSEPEHEGIAILVGGGASIEDELETIKDLVDQGGTVFAMNAASFWLREKGIEVDYQCIADAKEETAHLIDPEAKEHIIASQVHPKTMDAVRDPIVWHLGIKDIEDLFPEDRVKQGGYVILGGGRAVGNSATCVAYAKGFRDLHIFGFDSCHRYGKSHAYEQTMNAIIPTIKTSWAGREFTSSVAMKAQAEKFMFTSKYLKDAGCSIKVYGDGLLQTMYNSKELSEQEKYQIMWQFDSYREVSPGELIAEFFLDEFKPQGSIIDFGCGTGRAGLKFHDYGLNVLLIDFTDNCRDEEAQSLPFIQWDLSYHIPMKAEYGYCTDVMEHIPTDKVAQVIGNIANSVEKAFFQISTVDDSLGALIDEPLHLTVKPHSWWRGLFSAYEIEFESDQGDSSLFLIQTGEKACQ